MKQKQKTKDQHFVPRFYLKRFALKGQLQVFDVRAKRIAKPRPYGSVCYQKFFYAVETEVEDEISDAFETLFSQIENVTAKALPGIIDRAHALQLTIDDQDTLAYFMNVQRLRTHYFRELLEKNVSERMKWIYSVRATLAPGFRDLLRRAAEDIEEKVSDEQKEEVIQLVKSGEYNFRFDNSIHLNCIDEQKVNEARDRQLAKRWRIIFAEEPHHFITSDNPVVDWIPTTKPLFGQTLMEGEYLFALTPKILIETGYPDSVNREQQPVGHLSYHTANGKGVSRFNSMLTNRAHKFLYARQRDEFERLLRAISGGGALASLRTHP